jgi:hypothetical protein
MSDEPGNLDDKPSEWRYPEPQEGDPELERKVQAVLTKKERDSVDPKYNVLNAAVWHAYAGNLSNRITDLEAYFNPMRELLDPLKDAAREADNAADLLNILEKLEAYQVDASRYVRELRKLSDEIYREWGHVETGQGGPGKPGGTSE